MAGAGVCAGRRSWRWVRFDGLRFWMRVVVAGNWRELEVGASHWKHVTNLAELGEFIVQAEV
jgi:hypothetical protein